MGQAPSYSLTGSKPFHPAAAPEPKAQSGQESRPWPHSQVWATAKPPGCSIPPPPAAPHCTARVLEDGGQGDEGRAKLAAPLEGGRVPTN